MQKIVMTSKRHAKALFLKFRKASKQDLEGACKGPCPQIKEACKQTDVTTKRHVMALVLKLCMQANKHT